MYLNSEKKTVHGVLYCNCTYCRRWYGCPDSTTIRLNFVDEPMRTSRSTATDTYSHLNVELLLITVSSFHLFIFTRLFTLVVLAPKKPTHIVQLCI